MRNYLAIAALLLSASAHALTEKEAQAIAIGEGDARIEALHAAVAKPDEKTVAFLQALSEDAVKLVAGKPVIVNGDKGLDPVTGVAVPLPDAAEDVMNNNRMHGELDNALAALKLLSPEESVRRAAIKTLQGNVDEGSLLLLDKAFAQEAVADLMGREPSCCGNT